jgi:hypothetical protein
METTSGADEVVMVPVPARLLPDVYRLLSQLAHSDAPTDASRGGEVVAGGAAVLVDQAQGKWTREMLDELWAEIAGSGLEAVLNAIARESPQWLAFSDLAETSEIDRGGLRAELANLSKVVKRLFGRRTWPMSARHGMVTINEMSYRMPDRIAEWWLDRRSLFVE